jgi:FtsH-binding integral membrane protein
MKRLFSTSLKATVLATLLIWVLNANEHNFNIEIAPFIVLSTIPIWIVCFTSITLTIVPFSAFKKLKTSNKQVFKRYFPYYSICMFIGCVTACVYSSFDEFVITFFITAFFTATISWVWFFKKKELNTINSTT